MQNKGLCNTCVKDKECSFPRKFPMFLCDEFDIPLIEAGVSAETAAENTESK